MKPRDILMYAALSAVMFTSCFSTGGEWEDIEKDGSGGNVTLQFSTWQQDSFTRAAGSLADAASRLSVAVFDGDGNRVRSVTQQAGNAGYGTVSVSIAEGTYTVVAVGHNSLEGNATLTSPEKVTFASNKVSDTFAWHGTISVTGDDPLNRTAVMERVVAMVRLSLTEPLPAEIHRLKFYYTGGSSTLNPATGYGCVNSKQTEYRDALTAGGAAVTTFEIYTIPHAEDDALKIVITAQDATGADVREWTMEDVPVTRNRITLWEGSLGSGGGSVTDGTFTVTVNTDWDGTQEYSF